MQWLTVIYLQGLPLNTRNYIIRKMLNLSLPTRGNVTLPTCAKVKVKLRAAFSNIIEVTAAQQKV